MPKSYPSISEYNVAVAHLPAFSRHPLLQQATPKRTANGNLWAYSGGYTRVYLVDRGQGSFALRLWTAHLPGLRDRYRAAATYLKSRRSPYFVDFQLLDDALSVKGERFPVLWMEWAQGLQMGEFVGRNAGRRDVIRALADSFARMCADLHGLGVAHGDLQDANIIVSEGSAGPALKLVDYDSLFVPGLHGVPETIMGAPHYQHPRRATVRAASPAVDYFSELVIYLSLRAYAEDPALFDPRFEKRLLFNEKDFADPPRSPVFATLAKLPGDIPALADTLAQFCRELNPLGLLPLEEVLGRVKPRSPTPVSPDRDGGGPRSIAPDRGDGGPRSRRVFVVHGRNQRLRDDLFNLLRAAGLDPIEWSRAIGMTGYGAPFTGQVLEAAFAEAQAVVVLLTPDDEVRLREDLVLPRDGPHEREVRHQARPNVLFEAGMAFGAHPTRTILVQVGDVKPFSDVAGRHVVRLEDDAQSRHDLLVRLHDAGCPVDLARGDWMRVGKFTLDP